MRSSTWVGQGWGTDSPTPLVTLAHDPSLRAWRQRSAHSVPAVCPAFPALPGPTALSGGSCCWEGRKYKAPLSAGGKGRRWGGFRNCPVKFSREERGCFLLPGGWASGYFVLCWGRLSPGVSLSPPVPRRRLGRHSLSAGSSRYGRGTGRQRSEVSPEGAEGTRAAQPRPPAPPTPLPSSPARGAPPGASQTGSPPPPPALTSPATERKPRLRGLKQLPQVTQLVSVPHLQRGTEAEGVRVCGGGARGVRGPRCPLPAQPRSEFAGMCGSRGPKGVTGSPNRPDAGARVNFSLIRPGPAGRSPARDAPRSCHEAGARGAGPSAALGRSNGGCLAAEGPVPEWEGSGERGGGVRGPR